MDIYQFMSDSPLVTIIIVVVVCSMIATIVNRSFRHWNIRKHGYPPAHCDADGDSVDDSNELYS